MILTFHSVLHLTVFFFCVCVGAGALILRSHVALPARGWCGGVQVRGLASLKYRGMINVTITR